MKSSTLVALFFASSASGFMPSHPCMHGPCSSILRSSYLDELELESKIDRPQVAFPGEDPETTALANHLGIDDIVIRQEYGKWLARYSKSFDLKRYPQWKQNFLVQFQSDMKHGKFYSLNEYGDCTEEEFMLITREQEAAKKEAKQDTVEIIEQVKPLHKVSTQPTPVVVLAAEECSRVLKERFSATSSFMRGDTFQKLADLICGRSDKV